jgi:hypothetical protein
LGREHLRIGGIDLAGCSPGKALGGFWKRPLAAAPPQGEVPQPLHAASEARRGAGGNEGARAVGQGARTRKEKRERGRRRRRVDVERGDGEVEEEVEEEEEVVEEVEEG